MYRFSLKMDKDRVPVYGIEKKGWFFWHDTLWRFKPKTTIEVVNAYIDVLNEKALV